MSRPTTDPPAVGPAKPATPARLPAAAMASRRGPGGGGPWGNAGMPTEKSLNFGPSARRLLARLRPQRVTVFGVIGLAVASVVMSVLGPKILGHATDLIFDGVIGRRLPAGIDKAQAVASLRAQGQDRVADLVNGTAVVPGQGIDFHALGVVLVGVLFLYVGASVLSLLQGYLLNGAVQRTIFALRADVEDKLNRLPLRYFDQQPRGEVLSRVTNDIDNISQSLQQRGEVRGPDIGRQPGRKFLQHRIADVVTISVVAGFEVVDVERHHRHRIAAALRPLHQRLQLRHQETPIIEAGQLIEDGQLQLGALNTPSTTGELVGLPPEALAADEVVAYCGSGVLACVPLLALHRAGRADAASTPAPGASGRARASPSRKDEMTTPYDRPTDPAKRHSHAITDGPDRAGARSMLKAIGFTDEDLAKPLIGVATTWIETMPCNLNQRELAQDVKRGYARRAGRRSSSTRSRSRTGSRWAPRACAPRSSRAR